MIEKQSQSLFSGPVLRRALVASLAKLDPRVQLRNPVMFVVEIGAVITTAGWLIQAFGGEPLGGGNERTWFTFTVAIRLWLTVVFANLAEALAEGRGKAQAAALRAMPSSTTAAMRSRNASSLSTARRTGPSAALGSFWKRRYGRRAGGLGTGGRIRAPATATAKATSSAGRSDSSGIGGSLSGAPRRRRPAPPRHPRARTTGT